MPPINYKTMYKKDPIQEAEKIVKGINNMAGKYTRPILQRYPFLFAFLLTFGVSAILEGLRFFLEEVEFLKHNPLILILIGIGILLLTGTLYKRLEKGDE